MSAQSPRAFFMSALLHGLIAALILFLTWSANRKMTDVMPIVQLVQGEGNNYMATEAAALGTPGGLKVDVPAPKLPEPEAIPTPPAPAPEPVRMTPAPPQPAPTPVLAPAPTPKATEKALPKTTPSLTKNLRRDIANAEKKVKQQAAKERAAEAKLREAEEKKQQQLTKAQFDAQNKATKTNPSAKTPSTKVPKIDAEGIAKGVVGGSPKNISGGADGTAMTADYSNEMDAYFTYLKLQLRKLFDAPPGLNDLLKVDIEFRNHADGTITNARISRSSGNREFDQAALDALRKVTLPPRPDKKTATHTVGFNLRDPE